MSETLFPHVPPDLAGWTWERSPAGTVRLALAADGLATRYYPPTLDPATGVANALDEARALIARETTLLAQEVPTVGEVVEAFRYEALPAEARIVVQQATKEIHDELDTMRRSAIKIGQRLVEVKAALPHGGWGAWLAGEFGWSQQTATNYMRQAQLAAQNPKFLEFEDRIEPSARILLAAPSTPEPARDEALARAEAGERVRNRDAKEIVGAAKAAKAVAAPSAPAPAFDEAADPLSAFDRHVLAKLGYAITGRERLREDDVWEYELQPPPTTHGRPAAIWATLRRVGAIVSGMEKPDRPPPPPPAAPAPPVPAPAPEPLDGVGRQPYGAKGADRWLPAVPAVLIIGERSGYYTVAPLIRAETIYDTPTTVRIRRPDGKEETQAQHKVWAVPDDAAWAEIEAATAAFGAALAGYADVLRQLGRYADRLDAAGGMKKAPNPLCRSVARAEDPDHTHHSTWFLTAWFVPYLERKAIDRHTPKMLGQSGDTYVFAQADSFVLADDAAWERVSAAQQACKDAAAAAEALLHRLGTYDEALDGRHRKPAAPAAPDGWRWREGRGGPDYWQGERINDGQHSGTAYTYEAALAQIARKESLELLAQREQEAERRATALSGTFVSIETGKGAPAFLVRPDAGSDDDERRFPFARSEEGDGRDADDRALASTHEALDQVEEYLTRLELSAGLARASAGMRAVAAAQAQQAARADEPTIDDEEDLDAQMVAAVGAILGGLPEPALRILAAHLCFADVSDVAFTAPLEAIHVGFAEVARQAGPPRMSASYRAAARAALVELGLAGMPQKAAA